MKYLIIILMLIGIFSSCSRKDNSYSPEDVSNLICFWDFQGSSGDYLTSKGPYAYTLEEMNGPISKSDSGIFGPSGLRIRRGQWLRIKREDCPALNIHGNEEVTVVAWIKRMSDVRWQYIAGMWNERDSARQYALFTCGHRQAEYKNLTRIDAKNQTHGYVSDVGGATPDRPFSFSYATGKSKIRKNTWYMIGYTYDHKAIKVYFNGKLDKNGNYNPFYWDKPIYDGGKDGSDFTVAQRATPRWPEYPEKEEPGFKQGFGGVLGGLAVYNRALHADEIRKLYKTTME